MFHVPNHCRLKNHPILGSDNSYGNNGVFIFNRSGYEVRCVASDLAGWEHVSVSINRNRCPGWNIMCIVKDTFWDEKDTVIQFHPTKSEYVNQHPNCLHLWKSVKDMIKLPPSILVGIK